MEQVYKAPDAPVGSGHAETYQPRLLQTKGRLGRARYFVYSGLINMVLTMMLGVGAGLLIPAVGHDPNAMSMPLFALGGVFWVAIMVVMVMLGIRRLNDMNASGWVILLLLVPLANLVLALVLLFAPGTNGANKYGPPPAPNSNWVIAGMILVILLIIGWLGLMSGAAIPAYQNYMHHAGMEQMHH